MSLPREEDTSQNISSHKDESFDQPFFAVIDEVSTLSEKMDWTTGYYPGTEVKIYSVNK